MTGALPAALVGPHRLAVIIASNRPGRIGGTVGTWFAGVAAARDDVDVDGSTSPTLDQLLWWSWALREARAARPYWRRMSRRATGSSCIMQRTG
ncbi:MAG TPA: hypothetical protein VHK88_07645 [Aquihabitans sp.]|nr:hypothetical protein [Aquihabitans sp.]